MPDIAILGGCGHVGLPLGLAFALQGKQVVAVDLAAECVASTKAGRMPFRDEGADEALAKCLEAYCDDRREGAQPGLTTLRPEVVRLLADSRVRAALSALLKLSECDEQ